MKPKKLSPHFGQHNNHGYPAYMILPNTQGGYLMIRADHIDAIDNFRENDIFSIYTKNDTKVRTKISGDLLCHLYCAALNGVNVDYRTFQKSMALTPPKASASGIMVIPDSDTSVMIVSASLITSFDGQDNTASNDEEDEYTEDEDGGLDDVDVATRPINGTINTLRPSSSGYSVTIRLYRF